MKNFSIFRLFSLLLISWGISAFGHPAWVPWLGLFSSVLGIALFWHAVEPLRRKVVWSVLWFTAVQAIQILWLAEKTYMGPLIFLVYGLLALGMGCQFGVISWLFFRSEKTVLSAFGIAGVWVGMEWLRLLLLTGFPWNPLGLALAGKDVPLQFAALLGVYGMSFWVIATNAMALTKKKWLWGCMALVPYAFGAASFSQKTPSETLSVALVQTGLSPEQKYWDPKKKEAFIHPLLQWSSVLAVLRYPPEKIDLLVFPEAAFPYGVEKPLYQEEEVAFFWKRHFGEEPPFSSMVSNGAIARALSQHLSTDVMIGLDDEAEGKNYNAAFYFPYAKQETHRYEKRILVPIGEYLPLGEISWIAKFVKEEFGIGGVFSPGMIGKIFPAQKKTGIAICSEEVYSGLIHAIAKEGAEILVTLSNDAWFPNTALPQLHLFHGKIRAAENGLPVLRACNTGITAALNCRGEVISSLPSEEKGAQVLFVKLPLERKKTFYSIWGDGAIFSLSGMLVLIFLWKHRKSCPK